jgi:hypothetical protein
MPLRRSEWGVGWERERKVSPTTEFPVDLFDYCTVLVVQYWFLQYWFYRIYTRSVAAAA